MKEGIYTITNVVNGWVYVGQTGDLEKRWQTHQRDLNNNSHSNEALQYDWCYYGPDWFRFNVIQQCGGKWQRNRLERSLINALPYVYNKCGRTMPLGQVAEERTGC
ncbi:GIY-YIG nuclease family protein [Ramlibacter sp. AN1015]|uniref:GIY-YIG nuclease family protein n=1 Tax=Ramlibacter sp. AN1015 TaxID=3133428 RepID=UPI0040407381